MDEQGLRQLLQEHHRESFGWALCCCRKDRLRAEDVLQGAYLKVLTRKARFDGRGAFKTWLFAVIRTTARDEHRREVLRRVGFLRYAGAVREAHADPVTGEALDREQLQAVFRDALEKLPGRQRQVLQLVFYHDMSLSEAAGAMGVSIGSARTHYDRGKKALREQLDWKVPDELEPGSRSAPGTVQ
jgi:RNA polymerase sigma-70 factor (ECF subfamily)